MYQITSRGTSHASRLFLSTNHTHWFGICSNLFKHMWLAITIRAVHACNCAGKYIVCFWYSRRNKLKGVWSYVPQRITRYIHSMFKTSKFSNCQTFRYNMCRPKGLILFCKLRRYNKFSISIYRSKNIVKSRYIGSSRNTPVYVSASQIVLRWRHRIFRGLPTCLVLPDRERTRTGTNCLSVSSLNFYH